MGFAVDEQLEALGHSPPGVFEEAGHHERWSWQAPFLRLAELISRGGPTARMGNQVREIWTQALESVSPNGRVLVISHGLIIEVGLVTCIPDGYFATWGTPFHHLEGVEMQYNDGHFTDVRFLRVEEPAA